MNVLVSLHNISCRWPWGWSSRHKRRALGSRVLDERPSAQTVEQRSSGFEPVAAESRTVARVRLSGARSAVAYPCTDAPPLGEGGGGGWCSESRTKKCGSPQLLASDWSHMLVIMARPPSWVRSRQEVLHGGAGSRTDRFGWYNFTLRSPRWSLSE
jgi:hypothetical protein